MLTTTDETKIERMTQGYKKNTEFFVSIKINGEYKNFHMIAKNENEIKAFIARCKIKEL